DEGVTWSCVVLEKPRQTFRTSLAFSKGWNTRPASTGPTGYKRYSKEVTTPKFPPPPRTPQKRSACSVSLATLHVPSAVTMSTEVRLSDTSPYLYPSQPWPPPRLR